MSKCTALFSVCLPIHRYVLGSKNAVIGAAPLAYGVRFEGRYLFREGVIHCIVSRLLRRFSLFRSVLQRLGVGNNGGKNGPGKNGPLLPGPFLPDRIYRDHFYQDRNYRIPQRL